jgi:hypothetical protein
MTADPRLAVLAYPKPSFDLPPLGQLGDPACRMVSGGQRAEQDLELPAGDWTVVVAGQDRREGAYALDVACSPVDDARW